VGIEKQRPDWHSLQRPRVYLVGAETILFKAKELLGSFRKKSFPQSAYAQHQSSDWGIRTG